MSAKLDAEKSKKLSALISEALRRREALRTRQPGMTNLKVFKPLAEAVSLFPEPERIFSRDHASPANMEPYSQETLLAQTEVIWALSSLGTSSPELDCPQHAGNLYQYFCQDVYTYSNQGSPKGFASMWAAVTNDLSRWRLITRDGTKRPSQTNSPMAKFGAQAFANTNAQNFSSDVIQQTKALWVERCGAFTMSEI